MEILGNDLRPTKTYYISGLAWIDRNQNGIRETEEALKSAVIVSLYRATANGGIDTSGLIETTVTNENGEYIFTEIENGDYVLVFDYNSSLYKVTKYQVETAKSTENSDAISKTITLNGANGIFGVTDKITVNGSNLLSIDIGIVDRTNFDLKLEKSISKIEVKNDEGTKIYNYENNKSPRIEIKSKYYKSSVLNITYKFKITNEGDTTGYVNKVIDYLPQGVQVVLNRSDGWYISPENELIYNGLVDKEIKPGETKEFELVLRRSLEDGEAVKLINSAEILEYTNAFGFYDNDSIEGNKEKGEDDYSEITLLINVSTGRTVEYIMTILIIIIMISAVAMIIIKIKNTKKIYK